MRDTKRKPLVLPGVSLSDPKVRQLHHKFVLLKGAYLKGHDENATIRISWIEDSEWPSLAEAGRAQARKELLYSDKAGRFAHAAALLGVTIVWRVEVVTTSASS